MIFKTGYGLLIILVCLGCSTSLISLLTLKDIIVATANIRRWRKLCGDHQHLQCVKDHGISAETWYWVWAEPCCKRLIATRKSLL
jgi:hypothetical protein